MNIILIFLIAFLPAALWLGVFYFKDTDKEPRRWLRLCFLSGMVAVLPVLGFSSLWKIFTGVEWLFWVEQFSRYGILVSVLSIFWLAMLEEFFKHTAVMTLGNEIHMKFNNLSDGLIYSITAAVGFSFLENAAYLWSIFGITGLASEAFWSAYIFRGLGTMLGHIVFSGVFGFFWGIAIMVLMTKNPYFKHDENRVMRRFYEKFFMSSEPDKSVFRKLWETLTLYTIRSFASQDNRCRGDLSPNSLVAEGFWLATLLHTIFNILLTVDWQGRSLTFLVVPFLSAGLLFLLRQQSGMDEFTMKKKLPLKPPA